MKPIWLWLAASLLTLTALYLLNRGPNLEDRLKPLQALDIPKQVEAGLGPYPGDWFHSQRAFPFDTLNYQARDKALAQARIQRQHQKRRKQAVAWQLVADNANGGGRLTDVEFTPDDRIYIGSSAGGVFRTDDFGGTWEPLTDHLPSLSVGDLAFAPSRPETLYLGTGEANSSGTSATFAGTGVYKSVDGGDSWVPVGLDQSRHIGRIAVHPQDPDTVFVGAMGLLYGTNEERGLYRSKDGGLTWEQVLYLDDRTGCIDVAIDPQRPNRIYAVMWERLRRPWNIEYGGFNCGIFRSLDGGDTWTELTGGLPVNDGTNIGRIGIDIAESNPDVIFAAYANQEHTFEAVFRSTDGGDSWTQTNDEYLRENRAFGGFAWFFGNIRVDPRNPDRVFLLGLNLFVTEDGGQNWIDYHDTRTQVEIDNRQFLVHVDHHGMAFSPNDPDMIALGNDGGFYLSWTEQPRFAIRDNPANFQFYTCLINPNDPNFFFGGLQDNGTDFAFRPDGSWTNALGGDGFQILVRPGDAFNIFMEAQFGFIIHTPDFQAFHVVADSLPDEDRFNWNTPMALDPADPDTLYVGAQRLHRAAGYTPGNYPFEPISPDLSNGLLQGNRVWGTISAFAVAPGGQTIYAGTDDGNVHVTRDAGENWTLISQDLPNRSVTRLALEPDNHDVAYVTFSGYRDDDYLPHVLRTQDGGQSWQDISANLPEAPANDIIIDPRDRNTLYLASDAGVYISYDRGGLWHLLGTGMPLAPVTDIDLHPASNQLAAATFGRSMYVLNLDQVQPPPAGVDLPFRYALSETPTQDGLNTRAVLVNPNEATNTIALAAFSAQGSQIGLHQSELGPMATVSFDLAQLFPGQTPAWVQVGGTQPLHVTGERQGEGTLGGYWASDAQATTTFMPHVARDTVNFETFLSTANTSPGLINHLVHASPGDQTHIFRNHREAYTWEHGDIRAFLGANLDEVQFARLESDRAGIAAVETFVTQPDRNQLAALGLDGRSGTTLRFLHVAENTEIFWTGLVAINTGAAQTPLTIHYYDADGNLLDTQERPLQPSEKVTLLRDQNGSANIPQGTAWVEMQADQPLVGYELFGSVGSAGDRFFAGLQGNYGSGTVLDYPIFQADQDRWAGLVAVNTGSETANLSFALYDADGQVLETQVVEDVPPKAKITVLSNDFFQDDAARSNGAWVRATGDGSRWAGFQLWGDHNIAPRQNLAGIHAAIE